MAKIIYFPSDSCRMDQRAREARMNGKSRRLPMPASSSGSRGDSACIKPIWKNKTGMRVPLISVVLPAWGNTALLDRCLTALTHQTLPPAQYEILVVDSAPGDASRIVLEKHLHLQKGRGPCIIYLPVDGQHGYAAARNHGWQIARGILVAFTEEQAIPAPDWLAQGLAAFDGVAQAACGSVACGAEGMCAEFMSADDNADDGAQACRSLSGASFFCVRQVLENLGGFDERFYDPVSAACADVDMYFRLQQVHAEIAHAPAAAVQAEMQQPRWNSILKQQKCLQFDALLHKKHRSRYHGHYGAIPLWSYWTSMAALLAAITAFFLQRPLVALPAAACWLLLDIHQCLLLLRHREKNLADIAAVALSTPMLAPLALFWRLAGTLRFRA